MVEVGPVKILRLEACLRDAPVSTILQRHQVVVVFDAHAFRALERERAWHRWQCLCYLVRPPRPDGVVVLEVPGATNARHQTQAHTDMPAIDEPRHKAELAPSAAHTLGQADEVANPARGARPLEAAGDQRLAAPTCPALPPLLQPGPEPHSPLLAHHNRVPVGLPERRRVTGRPRTQLCTARSLPRQGTLAPNNEAFVGIYCTATLVSIQQFCTPRLEHTAARTETLPFEWPKSRST